MTTKIQIAIVGIGRWGVHLLRNFLAHPHVNVIALLDHDLTKLAAVKSEFNLNESVLLATQLVNLAQLSNLTALAIATPASTHYELIQAALKRGYHVLSEKPLTLDPRECQELCLLAEQQKLILMVDHTYLFHPAVIQGKNIIQSGQLGDLRYGHSTRTHLGPVRQDVDALWDLAIHDIAIFNTWLADTPIQVQATGTAWLQTREPDRRSTSRIFSLSDLVWIKLIYPSGFCAYIHLCWLNQDKQRRLGVVGSRASLIFDEMSLSPLTLMRGEFTQQENLFIPVNQSQETVEIDKYEPLKLVCDRFVTCILQNTPPVISSGWVGKNLVEILSALTESLNQGGIFITLRDCL
jgi:predicted dehydrogenase